MEEFELKENHSYKLYIKLRDSSTDSDTEIKTFKVTDHSTGTVYSSDDVPLSVEGTTGKAYIDYISSVKTVKKDKEFLLNFNSLLDEETVDNTVITISDDDENYVGLDLTVESSGKSILMTNKKGYYDNNFYTINISRELMSKGGNALNEVVNYPFYVPFH